MGMRALGLREDSGIDNRGLAGVEYMAPRLALPRGPQWEAKKM